MNKSEQNRTEHEQNKSLDTIIVQSHSNYTDMHMGVIKFLKNATNKLEINKVPEIITENKIIEVE